MFPRTNASWEVGSLLLATPLERREVEAEEEEEEEEEEEGHREETSRLFRKRHKTALEVPEDSHTVDG
jgi:hypothetical protein